MQAAARMVKTRNRPRAGSIWTTPADSSNDSPLSRHYKVCYIYILLGETLEIARSHAPDHRPLVRAIRAGGCRARFVREILLHERGRFLGRQLHGCKLELHFLQRGLPGAGAAYRPGDVPGFGLLRARVPAIRDRSGG